MDGINRTLLIFTSFIFLSSELVYAKGKTCNYDCPSGKKAVGVVERFLNQKKSCALPGSSDAEEPRSPAKGAAFMNPTVTSNGEFVTEALRVEGLRVYEGEETSPNDVPKNLQISDMRAFGKGGKDCFNPVYLSSNLKSGDIVIMDNQALILDQVPSDPFNIKSRLDSVDLANELTRVNQKNPKRISADTYSHSIDLIRGKSPVISSKELSDAAGLVCDDWTADPSQYKKITAFHETVKALGVTAIQIQSDPLIPTILGEPGTLSEPGTSGTGLQNLIEHAKAECQYEVFEAMKKHSTAALYEGPTFGHFTVLRHQSDIPQCRVTCSHCCDHVEAAI